MASRRKASGEAATKTYILELKNGDTRKITVPAHWKLTYGNVVPYAGKDQMRGGGESRVALRLYDGTKENLRAVYTDVVSFRDVAIGTLEKRTQVQRKASQRATDKGMRDVIVEARVTEWVDPDNEDAIPTPSEFKSISHRNNDDESEPF